MIENYVLSVFLFVTSFTNVAYACKGCVGLDEYSFEKIIPHFSAVLVKFDVAFPYGDKHEIFTKLAEDVAGIKDLLIAEVGVKDYGEKDNEALAKSFGVTKDDFPAIKLFKRSTKNPTSYPDNNFTLEKLKAFIRDNTQIYVGLPGCVEKLDKLAQKFMQSNDQNQNSVLKETENVSKSLKEKEQEASKTYIVIMKKVIESGKSFISQEQQRVNKLLKGKISSKKQTELETRINILRAFELKMKDEL